MKLQVLLSSMNANPIELVTKMNLQSDAILINQADQNTFETFSYKGHQIQAHSFQERGVGLSRNNALLRADHEISLFADDDIIYRDGYEQAVLDEFAKHPEADMIVFQFEVCPERKTYENTKWKRVRWYNCGRYPTFSFAIRTYEVHKRNITYSLLFGGGAKYSNGEDSLFIQECIQKGMKVFTSPTCLGKEEAEESTWFQGYTDKFFYDRGVLYRYLYGWLALPLAFRFWLRQKSKFKEEKNPVMAWKQIQMGMKEAKRK